MVKTEKRIAKDRLYDIRHYSKLEIDYILTRERIREVSLEGLITEISDSKSKDKKPHFVLNVVYKAVLEDYQEKTFVARAYVNFREEDYIYRELGATARSDLILEQRKNHLRVAFEQAGKDYVRINVLKTNNVIDTERDLKRLYHIYGIDLEKRRKEETELKRIQLARRGGLAAVGVLVAGIIYATCFTPRTIEDAKVVSIDKEEEINAKSGHISNVYKIKVDKHDDCLIANEDERWWLDNGVGLKVGDVLKKITWRPYFGECDYMVGYEK
ncbi:hypothetical protein HY636_04845 [Candidatus Woesearchaeota archaeon]|nr:hypothetical protein [Candidatus Woesearchaeota archaeon]